MKFELEKNKYKTKWNNLGINCEQHCHAFWLHIAHAHCFLLFSVHRLLCAFCQETSFNGNRFCTKYFFLLFFLAIKNYNILHRNFFRYTVEISSLFLNSRKKWQNSTSVTACDTNSSDSMEMNHFHFYPELQMMVWYMCIHFVGHVVLYYTLYCALYTIINRDLCNG